MSAPVSHRRPERVLITGSAGFIGARLVRSYLASGIPVRAVVRRGSRSRGAWGVPGDGLEQVELDLCERDQLREAFDGQDLVVHAAAVTRARDPAERRRQEHANVEMTRNVIQACREGGVPTLLHVSSTAAIGISSDPRAPADERFRFNLAPLDLSYNTSKHAAERLVLEANGPEVETVVVNPGVVFGSHHTRYMGGEVVARILRRPVVVCTGGGLSMVHVDDVVEGMRRAAERGKGGERYILSGENLSFRAIAEIVCRVAGVRRTIVSLPDPVRDGIGLLSSAVARLKGVGRNIALSRRYAHQFYSSQRAVAELGYRPRSFDAIVDDYLSVTRGSQS